MVKIPKAKLKNIKLFVTDIDGVLTDGGMYYGDQGEVLKKFNTRDGMGFELLRKAGIKVAVITGEKSMTNEKRMKKLNIEEFYQGIKDKLSILNLLKEKYSLKYGEIAYIGDDVNDISCLKKAGLSVSVKGCVPQVADIVDYVTELRGGEGAAREVCDMILASRR